MIYGFARQSGGQVRICSEPDMGTTISIYLPRHNNAETLQIDLPCDASVNHSGNGRVVLIIDDEPTIRMIIAEVLEDAGYHVVEASDGIAGLKLLQSTAKFDLLVTDVGLPGGINGRQVADAARVLRSEMKVLFITGYAENAVVGNGNLARGMEVMTKPFQMEAFSQKIHAMFDDEQT